MNNEAKDILTRKFKLTSIFSLLLLKAIRNELCGGITMHEREQAKYGRMQKLQKACNIIQSYWLLARLRLPG